MIDRLYLKWLFILLISIQALKLSLSISSGIKNFMNNSSLSTINKENSILKLTHSTLILKIKINVLHFKTCPSSIKWSFLSSNKWLILYLYSNKGFKMRFKYEITLKRKLKAWKERLRNVKRRKSDRNEKSWFYLIFLFMIKIKYLKVSNN